MIIEVAKLNVLIKCTMVALVFSATCFSQTYLDSTASIEARVNDLIGRMTLDEKIGQMMQLDLGSFQYNPGILTTYFVGSVLSGGGSDPAAGNSAADWANVYDTVQIYALKTRLKIPILYGVDAVHGHSNVVGATIFPHNIGLGCTRDSDLVEEAARVTAEEVSATGIDWTFAPCITVPRDERWGRTYEGFGESPELVKSLGAAAIRGFQGDSMSGATSIIACAKHFLGDGGTTGGIDRGDTQADEDALRKIHLPAYISAVNSGVGSIMVSYSSVNGLKMHANKYWITDVLRKELGFEGIVISDYGGIDQLSGSYESRVETSINAGIDMVMAPPPAAFTAALRGLVQQGKVDSERIEDAVRRILTAKFKLGLFEKPFADRTLLPLVGCSGHRSVARRCVRESLVLLKKKDGILPLKKNARILVAGSHADNIGLQCGGWTISWQGGSGAVTSGTTILRGMKQVAPSAQIEYSQTGDFTNTSADYAVVVIGEQPYAEGAGDAVDLGLSESLVRKMKSYGVPVIVVIISGRPLVIDRMLHFADVIIGAWLPGTEGGGVADILFGDYQPHGKLSNSWPRNMVQIPINVGDADYDPLYPYGFGIDTLADSPPGSSPVCLSSIITNDGRNFEMTFNKEMKDPASLNADFSFTRDGLPFQTTTTTTLKTNDSTTIVVELDSVCFTSRFEKGTIAYRGGGVASADGGALAPFSSMEVYNWACPAAVTIPARIQAENCSDMSGIDRERTSDVDGAFDVAVASGNWLDLPIGVPSAGDYYVFFRIASETAEGRVLISCAGRHAMISLPVTGNWQNWETSASAKIALPPGEQTLRLGASTGGFHLNWIYIGNDPTSIEEKRSGPSVFSLDQNFPNPFNPNTVISYRLSADCKVTLKVYDVLGREVATLVDARQNGGAHSVKYDCSDLSSGVYFYRLSAGEFVSTRKMVLLK